MTISEFVRENNVTMKREYADTNPYMDKKSACNMNHYKVTIKCNGHTHTTYFSQGYGITHDPKVEDVLYSLVLDATNESNGYDVGDYVSEYGYESKSKADYVQLENMVKACRRTYKALKRVFDDKFDELMECEE